MKPSDFAMDIGRLSTSEIEVLPQEIEGMAVQMVDEALNGFKTTRQERDKWVVATREYIEGWMRECHLEMEKERGQLERAEAQIEKSITKLMKDIREGKPAPETTPHNKPEDVSDLLGKLEKASYIFVALAVVAVSVLTTSVPMAVNHQAPQKPKIPLKDVREKAKMQRQGAFEDGNPAHMLTP